MRAAQRSVSPRAVQRQVGQVRPPAAPAGQGGRNSLSILLDNIFFQLWIKLFFGGIAVVLLFFGMIWLLLLDNRQFVIWGKISVVVIWLCLFALWCVWMCSPRSFGLNRATIQTWAITLLAIIAMMTIITVSMQIEVSYGWLGAYIPFLVIFLIVLGISIVCKPVQIQNKDMPWWRKAWNPAKGLAGGAFGDFANSIGILAGVGAYQLANPSPGWYWLGQFGASLSMIIGLNMCLRWFREKGEVERIIEYRNAPFYIFTRWTCALLGYCCGLLTFLAIITSDAAKNSGMANYPCLFWAQIVFGGLMIIAAGIILWKHTDRSVGDWILIVLIGLLTLGTMIVYGWPALREAEGVSNWYGGAATIIGALLEVAALTSYTSTYDSGEAFYYSQEGGKFTSYIKDWKSPLRVVRGLDIILGNIALFVLVITVKSNQPDYDVWQWFLFSGAIILMIQASLGGIVMSNHDMAKRHQPEAEYQNVLHLEKLTQDKLSAELELEKAEVLFKQAEERLAKAQQSGQQQAITDATTAKGQAQFAKEQAEAKFNEAKTRLRDERARQREAEALANQHAAAQP